MADDLRCDVAIIGAGTAGLAAERSARRAGARTLLIDPAFVGTTCATVGCMPSKLLIAAARAADGARQAAVFGLETDLKVNGRAVMARLRRERDKFAEATRDEIDDLPAGIRVQAKARFIDATTLTLDDGSTVSAKAIVIATGASPAIPKAFEPVKDFVVTNESIFELENLPETLAVIGGGPLGLELAQAMARLGVKVTLLDEGQTLAGLHDKELSGRVREVLCREFAIHLGVQVEAGTADGKARVIWTGGKAGEGAFDLILVATGRPPALDHLGLAATRLELDDHGTPIFDPTTMQCGASAIFIAGDADADRPVLHEASSEGAIAGANAASFPKISRAERCAPFSIMFTEPPLAVVGRGDGSDLVTGEADYVEQGRAVVDACAHGFARLLADASTGSIAGAVMFCPGADHLGHLLAWSIESGATADELLDRPFYHPTYEEGLKPALRSICAKLDIRLPNVSDEGSPSGS